MTQIDASPAGTETLALDDHLCFALYGAAMAIGRAYKPLLDEWGITYPQYLLLSALWEQDGQGVGALARRLALEPSTVTPLVGRLVEAGFVTRERDPDNRRQVCVALTDAGRALCDKRSCLADTLLAASAMDLGQLARLTRDIKALRDAVASRQLRDTATD